MTLARSQSSYSLCFGIGAGRRDFAQALLSAVLPEHERRGARRRRNEIWRARFVSRRRGAQRMARPGGDRRRRAGDQFRSGRRDNCVLRIHLRSLRSISRVHAAVSHGARISSLPSRHASSTSASIGAEALSESERAHMERWHGGNAPSSVHCVGIVKSWRGSSACAPCGADQFARLSSSLCACCGQLSAVRYDRSIH